MPIPTIASPHSTTAVDTRSHIYRFITDSCTRDRQTGSVRQRTRVVVSQSGIFFAGLGGLFDTALCSVSGREAFFEIIESVGP